MLNATVRMKEDYVLHTLFYVKSMPQTTYYILGTDLLSIHTTYKCTFMLYAVYYTLYTVLHYSIRHYPTGSIYSTIYGIRSPKTIVGMVFWDLIQDLIP